MQSVNEKTPVIQNNTFASGADGWVCSENPATSDNVAEYFWKSFSLKQKIEGLENGYYLATVQAFYRNGTHDDAFAAHQNGTEALNVLFFAGTKTAEVASIYNHHFDFGWNGYCNTMGEADRAFSADENNFLNYLIVKVDDGTLTVGLRKSVSAGLDWVCFDNFRLFNIPTGTSSVEAPRADTVNADANVYNLLGRVVGKTGDTSQLEPGVYITGHKKIMVSKR
jgi:hypothetical protein